MMDIWDIRKWARTLLKSKWLKAAGIALLVALCLEGLEALFSYVALHGLRMYTYSYESGVTHSTWGDLLVSLLLLPARALATMGLAKYYFMTAKGQSPTLRTCFYYVKHNPLRAIGLVLFIALITFAWILPGFAVILFAIALSSTFLVWAGAILAIAMGCMVIFRYILVPFYMVENPDCTIKEAFEQGADATKNHKWALFCLWFTTLGWASIAVAILQAIFDGLDAFPLSQIFTALSSPLTVFWGVASAIFYLERMWVLSVHKDADAPGAQNGESIDLDSIRIRTLESQVADLEQQLAEARKNPSPDMPHDHAEPTTYEDGGAPHGSSEAIPD